jgi:hypothetical protein
VIYTPGTLVEWDWIPGAAPDDVVHGDVEWTHDDGAAFDGRRHLPVISLHSGASAIAGADGAFGGCSDGPSSLATIEPRERRTKQHPPS